MKSIVWLCAAALVCSIACQAWAQQEPFDPTHAGGAEAEQGDLDADGEDAEEPADAEPGFDELIAQAAEAFAEKQYHTALTLFERAYALDADPAILFNMGIIADKVGDFQLAITYLNQFVMVPDVDVDAREEALRRIEQLEKLRALETQNSDAKNTTPEPSPTPPEPVEKPSYVGPIVVAGVGGLILLGGAITGGLAAASHSDFEAATNIADRRAAASSGEDLALVADVLFVGGGAVAVGGIVWLALVAMSDAEPTAVTFVPAISEDSMSLGVRMRF